MITDYNTVIIGAGAAGLFAASNLNFEKTLVIEKNLSPGKKMLISGAGQCNYTHDGEISDFLNKYGKNGKFLKPALSNLTNKNTIEYFEKNGLKSEIREDGKVFPKSMKAIDVVETLMKNALENGVEFKFDEAVISISHNQENQFFTIKTSKSRYTSQNILITSGGKSFPNTGSTGDGFEFANMLGHNITKIKPCLTPVNVKNYQFAELSGISFKNISISLYRDGKKINSTNGDLLFTHKNISGPAILDFSRYIEPNDVLEMNFLGISGENFNALLTEYANNNGKASIKSFFKNFEISKRFIAKILELNDISSDLTFSQFDKKRKLSLTKALTAYRFVVEDLGGYNMAMATCGGVNLDEINRKTMQSKFVDGLYFAGEVIDIDGNTGGYNIQAAFSTAMLAIKNIKEKNSNA